MQIQGSLKRKRRQARLTDGDDSVSVPKRSKRFVAHFGQRPQAYPSKAEYQVVDSQYPCFPEPLLANPEDINTEMKWRRIPQEMRSSIHR